MKITPVPSAVTPVVNPQGLPQQSKVDSIRSMRMNTNATPLPNELPIQSNNDSQTEATVEATQPLSPQLALLAKQKRALQVKEREIADREKALLSKPGTPAIDVARLKSDPLGVLQENGVGYDQLIDAITNGQSQSKSDSLSKADFEAMIDQRFTDKETAAETQVLAEMQREAEQRITADDEFEFVREQNAVPQVMDLIKRTYKESGEVLEVQEALRLIEEELFKDGQKLARLKKMQAQLAPPMPQPQPRQQGMRTLTNRDTASVPLSAKARAMAAFYGTLKK